MKKYLLNVLLILFILEFSACNNSYSSMLEKFNKKYFSPEPPEWKYSINNSDFNMAEMLEESYLFPNGMFVNLEAPEDGVSYSWKCKYDDGSENELSNQRILYYKTPGVFRIGEENTLVLTVTAADNDGNKIDYSDEALVIIKHSAASENGENE